MCFVPTSTRALVSAKLKSFKERLLEAGMLF
jgi:hypothetical protein